LAVLVAEVMTVTNPLAFQTVLGWPGLQTIARFHYYLFPRLILHWCWCLLWWHRLVGAWQSRECTFISQQPPGHVHIPLQRLQKSAMPSSFSCHRSKIAQADGQSGTNGTGQAGGGRGRGRGGQRAPRLPPHRFSAQSHHLDR
jgi:hypothetical protein